MNGNNIYKTVEYICSGIKREIYNIKYICSGTRNTEDT